MRDFDRAVDATGVVARCAAGTGRRYSLAPTVRRWSPRFVDRQRGDDQQQKQANPGVQQMWLWCRAELGRVCHASVAGHLVHRRYVLDQANVERRVNATFATIYQC